MADGSVRETASVAINSTSYVHGATLMFGQDFIVDLELDKGEVEACVLEAVAAQLVEWSSSTIHVARLRGENDSDLPGTLDGALGAAEVCVQLAAGFSAAARKMRKEKAHG